MGSRLRLSACLCGSLLFVVGCGGDSGPVLHPVKGTVKRDGKPLSGVTVTFSNPKGTSSAGVTNANGEYVLATSTGKSGAEVGNYKVLVTKAAGGNTPTTADGKTDWGKVSQERDKATKGSADGAPSADSAPKSDIPVEYSDPGKTPLSAEVKAGNNDIPLEVK